MNTSQESSSNSVRRNPLFAAAVLYGVGVYLYLGLQLDSVILLFALVISLLFSLVHKHGKTAFILITLLFAGYLAAMVSQQKVSNSSLSNLYDKGWIASGDPVEVDAVLTDHPQLTVDGVFITATATSVWYKRERIETSGVIRLFVPQSSDQNCAISSLESGNSVKVFVRLKREEQFRNPGGHSVIESLERRGIDATGSVKSCLLIEITKRDVSLFAPLYRFREQITKRILETHDRETAGIILASLVGNRNFLTKQSGEIFRENGTFHVLVISGLHITFIGGFLLLAARRVTKNRIWQFIIANCALWTYAILVGLQLPVLRAAVMYTIFLMSYAIHRNGSTLNSLGAAALCILVWRPSDLLNPSFQLTFLSIFAITGFAIPLIGKIRQIGSWMPNTTHPFPPCVSRPFLLFAEALFWSDKKWRANLRKQNWDCKIEKTGLGKAFADSFAQKILRSLFQIACVTISVQVFMLPLLVLNFHRIGTAAVFSNIFAGIAVVAQNLAAIIALAISIIDIESGRAFAFSMSFINTASQYIQQTAAGSLFTNARIPVYSGNLKIIYQLFFIPLILLAVCSSFWDPFKRNTGAVVKTVSYSSSLIVVVLALVIVFHPYSRPAVDGRLTVDFLDVGQGDSALVTFPDGTTLLIDGGGERRIRDTETAEFEPDRSGIGERVVSEFLWEKGYSQIDFVLSTHPDADHIKGLEDVLRNFDVRSVLAGGHFDTVPEFAAVKELANKKNIPIEIIGDGLVLEIGEVKITVLNPVRSEKAGPGNDDSVVLRISFGKRSFLLTGDIERETEKRLWLEGAVLRSDVIKVAHHGSRTSSIAEFVSRVQPWYAVIPVGKRSPYGHPHKEVPERWEKAGAKIFQTGEGTITFSTNGSDLRVFNYKVP